MSAVKRLLRHSLKRFLKKFEDTLDIFILSDQILMPFKKQLVIEIWEKLLLIAQFRYLTSARLNGHLDSVLGEKSEFKASIFSKALDPHRLFDIEFEGRKNGKFGPIGSMVQLMCRHYRVSDADVEDWTQEIYLKLNENDFHKLRAYRGNSSFLTYLILVVERLCIDEARSRWGRKEIPEEIKEMGGLASRLYILLYWKEKPLHEAYEQLSMEEGDSVHANFEEKVQNLAEKIVQQLGKIHHTRHLRMEDVLVLKNQNPGKNTNNEDFPDLENLAGKTKTPEEEAIVKDTLVQLKQDLFGSKTVTFFKLTSPVLEQLKLEINDEKVWEKLWRLQDREYEKEEAFNNVLTGILGRRTATKWQHTIVKHAAYVPLHYVKFINNVEGGQSIPKIAENLGIPLDQIYARLNRLKTEMIEKNWNKELIDQFFKR
ncbi:MAG: sigma-70 family RNA polymerase sigma factor [SAR324 cluster bacterium]|nr:sigma-70 family RNA polymerase sigma factor [SAR324 cluster bacterium]